MGKSFLFSPDIAVLCTYVEKKSYVQYSAHVWTVQYVRVDSTVCTCGQYSMYVWTVQYVRVDSTACTCGQYSMYMCIRGLGGLETECAFNILVWSVE